MHTQTTLHLTNEQVAFIEETLSNNEVSPDEELVELFVSEGIFEYQAIKCIEYRDLYLNNIFLNDDTPLRNGSTSGFRPSLQAA